MNEIEQKAIYQLKALHHLASRAFKTLSTSASTSPDNAEKIIIIVLVFGVSNRKLPGYRSIITDEVRVLCAMLLLYRGI